VISFVNHPRQEEVRGVVSQSFSPFTEHISAVSYSDILSHPAEGRPGMIDLPSQRRSSWARRAGGV